MRARNGNAVEGKRWSAFFLVLAVLFGGIVRFAPTVLARFPVNDGGMFYAMIGDLRENHFLLPATTSYNSLSIPFAYPPLSLYAGAVLSALGVPTMEIMRWLPALVSTSAIVAFYWMATQVLQSSSRAAMATVAYALMPRSFSWYVMGGGLSRSFGILFLLLTCASAWGLFAKPSWRRILLTAIFGAGAVLSHPETALHTAAACTAIWFFRGRTLQGTRYALLVAVGVTVLTSAWWLTVLANHGIAPFASALNTGAHSGFFWIPWLTMDFAEERFATLLTILGLLGFAGQCARRDWFLPVWLLLPFAVEPRSATAVAALSLALLAGVGLADIAIPAIAALAQRTTLNAPEISSVDWTAYMSSRGSIRLVTGYVVIFALLGAFAYDLALATYVVPEASREAMEWARLHTPADARFIVMTGRQDPFSDPSAEWFPALAQRASVNTVQGKEWTLGPSFMGFRDGLGTLTGCLNEDPACLDSWATAHQVHYDHIFVDKPVGEVGPPGLLLFQLRRDSQYSVIFENTGVVIFARKR